MGGSRVIKEKTDDIAIHTLSRASILTKWGAVAFGLAGVAFLYVYIAILDITIQDKILYAAFLTIALAFLFLGVYTIVQDSLKAAEREKKRKRFKSR